MFLVPVPDRTAVTLFEYMKRYIRRGSIITVGKSHSYLSLTTILDIEIGAGT